MTAQTVEPDFSGYATRHNVACSDGRTILDGAFADNDGAVVPLVWSHGHDDPENVLGHVKLENRPDGVYCHAFFNGTAKAQHMKESVRHGDVKFLSIFANQLRENIRDRVQNLRDVVKGNIREVSLVLAGANPGAFIEEQHIAHSGEDYFLTEAVITSGVELELPTLQHAASDADKEDDQDDEDKSLAEILRTLNHEQEKAVNFLLAQALLEKEEGATAAHSDTDSGVAGADETEDPDESAESEESEETSDGSSDASEDEGEEDGSDHDSGAQAEGTSKADVPEGDAVPSTTDTGDDAVQHDDINQEDSSMSNVFDQNRNGGTAAREKVTLSHDAIKEIVRNAKRRDGSLKEAIEDYVQDKGITVGGTLQHGVENIEYLFPDAKTLESSPAFISRRMEWVDKVLSGVRKSPFSRIKTITADITPDEARARGYIKGNMKNEEFFALSKRETTPQTIYKKQKLDRDDVIDIVDLDVVAWLKAEMKVMLDEELAGAILVGDGRSIGDDDKIKETNIRPIASDAELYVTTVNVNLADGSSSVEELVDAVIANRKYYKGTGQPVFYTTEAIIAAFLTVKDNFGRRIYSNLAEVAAVLRVSDIVPVEVMERVSDLVGIMVNLADYTLGADRAGQATMFDDFDINYNKLLYLIETRCSGALTTPKAALVFRSHPASSQELAQPEEPTFEDNVVTVPTVTHVTYKNADTNATLTTGSPVTLTEGQTLRVIAIPAAGKYFPNNAEDEWTYTYQA